MNCLRYSWIIAAVVVAMATAAGCAPYEPKGPRPKPDQPSGDANDAPQNSAPKPAPKPRTDSDETQNTLLAPIELSIAIEGKDPGHYFSLVRPSLEKSCVLDGCHHQPEFIDLTKFPFQAQGSYVMDRIHQELGESPPPEEVQKMIVEELISSMETQYMPPASHPPADDGEIKYYRDWLANGLEVTASLFAGKFLVWGKIREKVLCHQSWVLDTNESLVRMEREPCRGAEEMTYQVHDQSNRVIHAGDIEPAQFFHRKKWRAVVSMD